LCGGGGAILIEYGGHATLTDCTFNGNTDYLCLPEAFGGGAIFAQSGAEVLIIFSSFKGGAGSHTDSVNNQKNRSPEPDANVTFACPSTSTGAPYTDTACWSATSSRGTSSSGSTISGLVAVLVGVWASVEASRSMHI
jgi:hypothetical protein